MPTLDILLFPVSLVIFESSAALYISYFSTEMNINLLLCTFPKLHIQLHSDNNYISCSNYQYNNSGYVKYETVGNKSILELYLHFLIIACTIDLK